MKDRLTSGYNLIAPIYDDLAGLVFGKNLFDAQTFFIGEIPDRSNVLILGGGSGWFLPELFQNRPGIQVYYIDASETMIQLAQKRKIPILQIHFIQGTERSIPINQMFDVVILNFYVDGFPQDQLPGILQLINSKMKPGSLWLITDFMQTGKRWHQVLMWITHLFFKILIGHPNKGLVPWWKTFETAGFKILKEQKWSKGLIRSIIYSK